MYNYTQKPLPDLIGKQVPQVTFKTRVRVEESIEENPFTWKDVTSNDIFANKKVIIVALPGAFTPTCSSTHLPGYEKHFDEFAEFGVDKIYCLSVNDAFVMYQWGLKLGVSKVQMLPDGNADFTRELGMLVQKQNLGFGERSWRYSMLVENGVIKQVFAEEGFGDNIDSDPFEVSDSETILNYLKSQE